MSFETANQWFQHNHDYYNAEMVKGLRDMAEHCKRLAKEFEQAAERIADEYPKGIDWTVLPVYGPEKVAAHTLRRYQTSVPSAMSDLENAITNATQNRGAALYLGEASRKE